MNELVFEAADEQATDRFGAALAAALAPAAVGAGGGDCASTGMARLLS